MTYGGILANVAGTAWRYGLKVAGESYANRTDFRLAPITLSLQGPGGASQLSFTVIQASAGYTGMAPFWGGKEVLLYDWNLTPNLLFRGKVVNTRSRRAAGSANRLIDVIAIGLDYYLDKRVIDSMKSRTNTSGRVRKFDDDNQWVRRVMEKAGLHEMVTAGTYINQTATDVDPMHFKAMTVRECLDEIADQAQPLSDYRPRRYYVDGPGNLHWYKSPEGLVPPARISDASFFQAVRATSITTFWSGRVRDANTIKDELNVVNLDLNGGFTTGLPSLCYNHPEWPSFRLNGSTGYASASDASLHPGNTGSWMMAFRRGQTGTAETLWSGGTDDIQIGFDATDHIQIRKEGTGNLFVSNNTYDNTTKTYHLVVTHSPANDTIVYVNGQSIAASATASLTLVAGSNQVNIGRKKSTADSFYKGRLWGVGVSGNELSSSTIGTLFNLWDSIMPDNVEVERDSTDVVKHVYVKGGPTPGSGWVSFPQVNDPNFEPTFFDPLPEEVLDRPDTHVDGDAPATKRKRQKFANSYMSTKAGTVVSITFDVTLDPSDITIAGREPAFRPGQTVVITSNPDNLSSYETEVRQVDLNLEMGNGVQTFSVSCGALPASALRNFRSVMR